MIHPSTNPISIGRSDAHAVPTTVSARSARTGLTPESLRQAFADHLRYSVGRHFKDANTRDHYQAAALTIRDRLLDHFLEAQRALESSGARVVAYLSAEFLTGPHLGNNLLSLGIFEQVEEALSEGGLDLSELMSVEEEPGLGNGGLGRLAACYMESLASLSVPAVGYGIRYEFGIFDQELSDGWQREITDKWLRYGNPWELKRSDLAVDVKLGGHCEVYHDDQGRYRVNWIPGRVVKAIPYDTPILGYGAATCNALRLWESQAVESFDFAAFNVGDYYRAVDEKVRSENLTKVLYPNDEQQQGRRLRLEQQYFLVSASLQDMLRTHEAQGRSLSDFSHHFVAQLNDTHPSLAIVELMRLLIDERGTTWEAAWEITRNTFAYTNHTLLPEALETWPVSLLAEVLPRHLQLIYELNRRLLDVVGCMAPGDGALRARISLIDETGEKRVRMAHLAAAGSFAINGVAELHTRLLEQHVMKDFFSLWPERFSNKTNGVNPRRFLALCNRPLARLISDRIGTGWLRDLEQLRELEAAAEDEVFRQAWRKAKRENKTNLAGEIAQRTGVLVDPSSLFDVQVKRIHQYKRQHLNLLHVLTCYLRLKDRPTGSFTPRTFILGGKAAPGYRLAKLIIKLATACGRLVNGDPEIAGRLRVVFFPDFNVTNAQLIYPAAELSEQISMAGKEASGTGNMKMTLNGALTIGTLDGANIELRKAVGKDSFFSFGLDVQEAATLREAGYHPREHLSSDPELGRVIDLIASGALSGGDPSLFAPLLTTLLDEDPFLVLADYRSYVDCQDRVGQAYENPHDWTRRSIQNVARAGRFSSDRAVREYCRDIWKIEPLSV